MSKKIERAIDDFGECCWKERAACVDGAPTGYPLAQRASEQARAALLAAIAEAVAEEREAERQRIETAWDKDRMKFVGHDHWDHTMQHGAGCYRCIDIRKAMDSIDAAVRQRGERGGGSR